MNRKIFFVFIRFQVIFLLMSLGLWGCGSSYKYVTPTEISLDSPKERLLTGVSVALKNTEGDSTDFEVRTEQGNLCGCIANRRAWTDVIVNALNRGLKDRGALITHNPQLAISIAMPKITCQPLPFSVKFNTVVDVTTNSGWKKTYLGAASAGGFSASGIVISGVDGSLSDAVMLILKDEEFRSVLKAETYKPSNPIIRKKQRK
jgi:hypothetical protein